MRRRTHSFAHCIIALCGAWLLTGCSAIGYADPDFWMPSKRRGEVRTATEAFATSLRWGMYEAAAMRVEPTRRIDFLKVVHDPSGRLRFTDYQVLAVELGPGARDAKALVAFRLQRLPSMTEVNFSDEQTWRYEPSARAWFLVPQLSAYRDAGKPLARE